MKRICIHIVTISLIFAQGCSRRYHTSRSPLRMRKKNEPEVTVHWKDTQAHTYTRVSSHYEQYPLFEIFNKEEFDSYTLPSGPIACSSTAEPTGEHLNALIENLVYEIQHKKKEFTDFIVLRKSNFNRRKRCGLMVLRFKEYPFVVKLFMETPKTFVNPYCKGFEPITFFFMAGGSNRHIAGLTRIPNLNFVKNKLEQLPQWHVKLPRKWFWTPKNLRWMHVEGKNIGDNKQLTTDIPETFAVIADAIDVQENHTLSHSKRNQLIMQLCTDLDLCLDPHSDNFIVTTDNDNNTVLYAMDTEHFPSMVGLQERTKFKSHAEWYIYLASKCAYDTFFRTKDQRKKRQEAKVCPALLTTRS